MSSFESMKKEEMEAYGITANKEKESKLFMRSGEKGGHYEYFDQNLKKYS